MLTFIFQKSIINIITKKQSGVDFMFKNVKKNKILLNIANLNISYISPCCFDCKNKLRSSNL